MDLEKKIINRNQLTLNIFVFINISIFLAIFFVGPDNYWFDNTKWLYESTDLTNSQLSWEYFKNDEWRFPIGKNPNYGLEVSNSIVYTDNIPILALFFKIFEGIIYNKFQYFSLWITLTFFFQLFFSYLLLIKATKNNLFSFFGSFLFLLCPFLFFRLSHHFSLGAHWLILYAFYTRPYLIFFPIFLSLYFILSKKLNHLKISSLYYLIFSVPGFTLLYLWGGSLFMGEGFEKTNFIYEFHHPRFVLKNLIFFASIFYFYLLPFKIIEKIYLLKKNKNLIDFKTLMIFMIFFLFLFFLYYFNFLEFLTMTKLGGGFFLKLNNLIFEKNYIIFILFSSFGFVYIFEYMQMNKRNIILFLSLLIYCFPKFIFQEYFEPLVLILFFTLIELKKSQIQALKNSSSFVIVFTYFLIFLFTSFYYRYFIF